MLLAITVNQSGSFNVSPPQRLYDVLIHTKSAGAVIMIKIKPHSKKLKLTIIIILLGCIDYSVKV
jgi:hypothetical protein